MAKPKNCVAGIPALYRADTVEHILFGYVRGCQACEPTRSTSNIIESFLLDFDLVDTFDKESALVVFQRINKRYRQNDATI